MRRDGNGFPIRNFYESSPHEFNQGKHAANKLKSGGACQAPGWFKETSPEFISKVQRRRGWTSRSGNEVR